MKMCSPQKQVKAFYFSCIDLHHNQVSTLSLPHLFFLSRVRFPHGLHLSGPEGVFAVFQDSGSHLLGSLQRDAGVGPAPTPQHTLHTPHTLLPAARPARAGGH